MSGEVEREMLEKEIDSRRTAKGSKGRMRGLRTRMEAVRVLGLIKQMIRTETALRNISEESNSDPFTVLISTILSARTKDAVTEKASAKLFSKYPDATSLGKARAEDLSELIKPVGFYTRKARLIIETSKEIKEKFGGKVPNSYQELTQLPGVGRKTAGCVLVYGFGIPAIPVDTHVHRISNRIGLVDTRDPEETEVALSKLYPEKYWLDINELFVSFGKEICKPGRPLCEICSVKKLCNYYQINVNHKEKRFEA